MAAETGKQAKDGGKEARRTHTPKRKTRFLFKLLGLALVGFAGWLGYFMYKNPKVDLLDEEGRKTAQEALRGDLNKAVEKARPVAEKGLEKATEFLKYTFEDLKKRMKGAPPDSEEAQVVLFDESVKEAKKNSKSETAAASRNTGDGAKATDQQASRAKPQPEPAGAFGQAEAAYQEGSVAFAKAHPVTASSDEVQKYIREAAPYFERCLDLCEKARAEGADEGRLERLEQAAANRLYTCRKRMALNMH